MTGTIGNHHDAYVADRTGHCRLCQNLTWPCTLWTIARHAKALAERR
jgi:hypothetical protein